MAFRPYRLSITSPRDHNRMRRLDSFNSVGAMRKRIDFWRKNYRLNGAQFVVDMVNDGRSIRISF
jgi:hypothetical protein